MQSQYTHNSSRMFLVILETLPDMLWLRAFPVIPETRVPAVKAWQILRTKKLNQLKTVDRYQAKFPNHALGIRMGYGPAGDGPYRFLIVIDVDHPKHLTAKQRLVLESWPWLVRTRRGIHAYGILPEGVVYKKNKLPWGELLSQGNYAVAPGNRLPCGRSYTAAPGFGQGECPVFIEDLLLDLGCTPEGNVKRSRSGSSTRGARGDDIGRLRTGGSLNPAVWDALRHWAYRQPYVNHYVEWEKKVQDKALALNLDLTGGQLSNNEVTDMASRVTQWVWERREKKEWRRPLDYSDSEVQAELARRKAASVHVKNADRDYQVRELFASGMSKRQIARQMGCSEGTVRNVLKRSTLQSGPQDPSAT